MSRSWTRPFSTLLKANNAARKRRMVTSACRFGWLLCAVALAGCATLTPEQCRTVNWYDLGQSDGASGYELGRLAEHRDACAKVGIPPDEAAYLDGRNAGLTRYCVANNAVTEGLAGRSYRDVCPPSSGAIFLRNYNAAYAVYEARQKIEAISQQLAQRETESRDEKTPEEKRQQLHGEMRQLDREREAAREELSWRERDLDRIQRQR